MTGGRGGGLPVTVLLVIVAILGIELVLQAADFGLIGQVRWRSLAFQNFAFWPGLLGNWTPNYPVQPATMFATYAALHSGLSHVLGNAITFYLLGPPVCARFGQRGFLWIAVASAMGGALAFAALSDTPQPMVGASGVVFGLAGALTAALWTGPVDRRRALRLTALIVAILILLNAVVWWTLDGLLAWQTHLGGFLAGFAMVFALPRGRS